MSENERVYIAIKARFYEEGMKIMSKYHVGQKLKVIKPCGFKVGDILPVTEIKGNDYVIDGVTLMTTGVLDTCFRVIDDYKKDELITPVLISMLNNIM